MREIHLVRGEVALVDDDVYDEMSGYRWYSMKGYATRGYFHKGRTKHVRMHRAIVGAAPGVMVDHINGNTLDNRRENLRVCSNSDNQKNRHRANGSSRFKGVCWNKQSNKWQAGIKLNGKSKHLGLFGSEEDAARAYDQAAAQMFGEFARPNFAA